MTTSSFLILEAFENDLGMFCMTGDVISGKLRPGMVANLIAIGIDRYVGIEDVGFLFDFLANDQQKGITIWVRSLGTRDREFIRKEAPFKNPVELRGNDE